MTSVVEIDLIAGAKSSGEAVYERLPARRLRGEDYELLASPMLVLGVAAGDRISIRDGRFEVLERSGNVAVQVFGAPAHVVASLREAMSGIGGKLDGQEPRAAVFTVPVSAGFEVIEETLNAAGVEWYYGNVYADDGVTPLGWWDG